MKVQFRSILFALVLPVAACGGDRDASVGTTQSDPFKWEPKTQLPVEKPAVATFIDLSQQFSFILNRLKHLEKKEPSEMLQIAKRVLCIVVRPHLVGGAFIIGAQVLNRHAASS